MKHYSAPWGASLIVISSLVTVLCIGVTLGIAWRNLHPFPWWGILPLVVIAGAALFTIRGYTITANVILVHRLLWTTHLPLTDLQSAQFEPEAMRRSMRTFGNGGLFSFTGSFRNKRLGAYRAFVTDPRRTVVLRYPARVVVLSPTAPEEFVRDLIRLRSLIQALDHDVFT